MKPSIPRRRSIERNDVVAPQARRLLGIALLALVSACGCDNGPTPTRARVPAPAPATAELDVEAFAFEPPELKKSYQTFVSVARKFCSDGFAYRPFRSGGNYPTAYWTKGGDFRGEIEFRYRTAPPEDLHQVFLQVYCLPAPPRKGEAVDPARSEPCVRHALVGATFIPCDPDRWCVAWGYSDFASRFGGLSADWNIRVCRWDAARLKTILPFRPMEIVREEAEMPLRAYTGKHRWGVPFERQTPRRDDFFRRIKSAVAMRDAQLADIFRLEADVMRFLLEGRATKLVSTGPQQSKLAPQHKAVPLTDDELAGEIAKAKAHFDLQRKTMTEHHEAIYLAFRSSFPIEECWPELVPNVGR